MILHLKTHIAKHNNIFILSNFLYNCKQSKPKEIIKNKKI